MRRRAEGQFDMPPFQQARLKHELHSRSVVPSGTVVDIGGKWASDRPEVHPAVISNSPFHGLCKLIQWAEDRYVIHIPLENAVASAALDIDLQALEVLGACVVRDFSFGGADGHRCYNLFYKSFFKIP